MSGNSVLLDTNIVLYLLNGDHVLADLLYKKKLYLSFINQLELLGFRGITKDQHTVINRFIKECVVIDVNEEIKSRVISIRKASKLKLPDSIILATAQFLDVPLITSDIDFKSADADNVIIFE